MKKTPKSSLMYLLIVFVVSTLLIFYKFDQIPQYLAFDEALFGKIALSLDHRPYTPFSTLADGHATVYFYILLMSLKLFGVTSFALRLPNGIFGVLTVCLFYLILTKVFTKHKLLPLFLSLVFLTAHWYFNFVRFSFETPYLLFLELLAIYLLLNYLQTKNKLFLIFTGICAGLAFNSYQPGRVFFVLPLIALFIKKERIKSYLLYVIPFIIVILPLTLYLLYHPQFDIRINQQFFLKNSELSVPTKVMWLSSNIGNAALMFHIRGDGNGRHNYPFKPALNPVLGLFFLSGLILAVVNRKKFYNQFFLLYFFLAMLPAILTYPWENPNMLRTFTVIPSVVYFAGVASVYILENKRFKKKKRDIFIILMCLFLFSSFYELRTYFKYQSKVFEGSFQMRCSLERLVKYIKFDVTSPPRECRY